MKLWSIEGNRQRLDGGAMFGNAPKPLWQRWATPDDHNRIELACRALLVEESGGRKLLFESGIGSFFEPAMRDRFGVEAGGHLLLKNLEAAGTSHEEIDVVVLSHLHFDHAGGLLSEWREGEPHELLFPNARFVVGELAWERCRNPHPRDRASFIPALTALLEQSGRLVIERGSTSELLGEGYSLHCSSGHTPGLIATEIATPWGPLVVAADLIPGEPWVRGSITMGYDRFPELLIDEKRALMEGLIERDGALFFTHDPNTAAGRLGRDERGRFALTSHAATLDSEGLNARNNEERPW